MQNGPVFFQGFKDGNTVRLYDPGSRFPGNEYERLYEKATGLSLMESIISYVVGGQIKDFNGKLKGSYDLNGKLVVQYMINLGPGKIACFDGLSKIAKLPNVIDIQQRHFVGETIENTGDIKHRAGEISIIGSRDLTDIENTIQFIQDNLIVKDSDGNNMLISPFLAENMETYYRN